MPSARAAVAPAASKAAAAAAFALFNTNTFLSFYSKRLSTVCPATSMRRFAPLTMVQGQDKKALRLAPVCYPQDIEWAARVSGYSLFEGKRCLGARPRAEEFRLSKQM
jgi:hypothetical protein